MSICVNPHLPGLQLPLADQWLVSLDLSRPEPLACLAHSLSPRLGLVVRRTGSVSVMCVLLEINKSFVRSRKVAMLISP